MKGNLLIIDDEPNIGAALKSALELEGYRVTVALSGRAGLQEARAGSFHAILLDLLLPDLDGLSLLKTLREEGMVTPTVMMSGHGTIESAVQATKLGAFDFLEKPVSLDKVLLLLEHLRTISDLTLENLALKEQGEFLHDLVGHSPVMRRLIGHIAKIAQSDSRALITGENGVGKELVARALHANSERRTQPFIKLNCAAIPDTLIESELFGHEKGAFTGAVARKPGKFELANGGTLFLDEIGDMSASAQAKVLRALQEGEVERVGGTAPIRVDVRVLAATNKDLKKAVAEKTFREDLYYRLNVVPIHVPPLRERREDIPALVQTFLVQNSKKWNKKTRRITPAALACLQPHAWPGNVRELQNVVERLLILSSADPLDRPDLEDVLGIEPSSRLTSHSALVRLSAHDTYKKVEVHTPHSSMARPYKEYLQDMERSYIQNLIQEEQGNMSSVARRMGIERSHLYKKLKSLGID